MKNKNGITLIALIITIIILIILAAISIINVTGDNGIITNAMKMEVETAKAEVRDHFRLRITEETAAAAADLVGTAEDLKTRYNEVALIKYLKGNPNYAGKAYEEKITEECIREFTSTDGETGVFTINVKYRPDGDTTTIYNKYKIISTALCANGKKYGSGKNTTEGNVFTLEAVGLGEGETYEGKFELKYYDNNGNVTVLDTYSLYLTNQS